MNIFRQGLNRALFLVILIVFFQKIEAQDEYYLDSISVATFFAPSTGHLNGTKYFYNKDYKIAKIKTDIQETIFSYKDNTITQEQRFLSDINPISKTVSIFNEIGQLVVYEKHNNHRLVNVDSLFYKNEKLKSLKKYEVESTGNRLVELESYSYKNDGLLESKYIDQYSGSFQLTNIAETYKYDLNNNITAYYYTRFRPSGEIYYDSTTYIYTDDQKLYERKNVLGSNFSVPNRKFFLYSYQDNKTLEQEYSFELNEWRKGPTIEIHNTLNEYFSYDTLRRWVHPSETDSVINKIETNQLIQSVSGDTIQHRNAITLFNPPNVRLKTVSKNFYVRYPEFDKYYGRDLEEFIIFPNPVISGGVLEIPNVDFEFDYIVIYSVQGEKIHFIKADVDGRFFNAPQLPGIYFVQLWNKGEVATEVKKIVVN